MLNSCHRDDTEMAVRDHVVRLGAPEPTHSKLGYGSAAAWTLNNTLSSTNKLLTKMRPHMARN